MVTMGKTVSPKRQRYTQPIVIDDNSPVSDVQLEQNVIRSMATFMAMNNLPLRITVSDAFRELVTNILALRSPYIMSIPNIRNESISTHMALRQALFTMLSMPNTYLTFSCAAVTNLCV